MAKLGTRLAFTDDQVREIMLQYFYDRNKNATSRRGRKTGAAATITSIRGDVKQSHGITVHQVHGNLTYLLSQGWVEEATITKNWTTPTGGTVPSSTPYYIITAAGIDRIAGPSAFTRDRFEGIKIEATGQNIITLGDGNQVDARFQNVGEALSELREAIKASDTIEDAKKLDLTADIDSLHAQLAKATPNATVIGDLWDGIQKTASIAGLGSAVAQVAQYIAPLLGT